MRIERAGGDDPSQWCVIVDPESGEIIQVHQNIALLGAKLPTKREFTARALASAMGAVGESQEDVRRRKFEIIHPPEELALEERAEVMLRNGEIELRPHRRRR